MTRSLLRTIPTMHAFFAFLLFLLTIVNVANADTKLEFPWPRGAFNRTTTSKFCNGFNSPSANRTKFPLELGFITILQDKPVKTTISVSSASNTTSINDFSVILTENDKPGGGPPGNINASCISLNLKHETNSTALQLRDGQNVTLQVAFDTGDGISYQCADLTLASDYKLTNIDNEGRPSIFCPNPFTSNNGNVPTATSMMPFSLALLAFAVAFMPTL